MGLGRLSHSVGDTHTGGVRSFCSSEQTAAMPPPPLPKWVPFLCPGGQSDRGGGEGSGREEG